MERTEGFAKIMQELRTDLIEEVKLVEKTVVDPLTDIKVSCGDCSWMKNA